MNVDFSLLELLPEIKQLLVKSSSPYLSKKELCDYLKVSLSFIKQKLYNGEFQLDKHYFKIGESKILFDRLEIDKWVRAKGTSDGKLLRQKQQTLSKYISQRTKDY
ncbi:helix-turn-helix transcriptional regulator [Sulfurimonas marina]|uniref:helix-turn-helix transcriptional regulator n=1 Tax=Sulfurimonas marina TaxID=2590551 RepID=UPI00186866E3|nr:helix-turn-helix domain-containing protein [Sulfurimonas marina]